MDLDDDEPGLVAEEEDEPELVAFASELVEWGVAASELVGAWGSGDRERLFVLCLIVRLDLQE